MYGRSSNRRRYEESSEESDSSTESAGIPTYRPGKSRFGIIVSIRFSENDADDAYDVIP